MASSRSHAGPVWSTPGRRTRAVAVVSVSPRLAGLNTALMALAASLSDCGADQQRHGRKEEQSTDAGNSPADDGGDRDERDPPGERGAQAECQIWR